MKPGKIHFWSSTEYSGFLERLMKELNAHGFSARQRFQISESSYRAAKSPVARLWLRVRQYLVYPVQLAISLFWGRACRCSSDVCVVSTNTFYAPLLATYLHPNVVHLIYDLFPEAMIHSGKWREGSLKVKWVRWITKQTLRRARQNVFLGQHLEDYVELIHGSVPNATIIEVGADQTLFETSEDIKELTSEVEILYCGNFGNLHDSATLFQYWNKVAEGVKSEEGSVKKGSPDSKWRFHCSGPKRAELIAVRETLPDRLKEQIQIGGGLGQSEWVAAMNAADVALVTMSPGSETVVMPSKTYSAMMAGQAILAIAPEQSDLVDRIKAADCGWWVEPGDIAGLEKTLDLICGDMDRLLEKRKNAHRYAHECLGQNVLAEKWQALFKTS